jgi:hypothetical protein
MDANTKYDALLYPMEPLIWGKIVKIPSAVIANPRQIKIKYRTLFKSRIFETKKKAMIKAMNANASFR